MCNAFNTAFSYSQAAPTSLAESMQLLEELEIAGASTGGAAQECRGKHGLPALVVQFGQLVVQLYLQRGVHLCPLASRWAEQRGP